MVNAGGPERAMGGGVLDARRRKRQQAGLVSRVGAVLLTP
jgi:hypothetical protein